MLKLTDVVKHLLIINVLIFLIGELLPGSTDMLALRYPTSEAFRPFQIVSHFFMHGGFMHLLFNMFALVMFGSALEMLWGPKKFLFFYFVCAFGAALLHMGYSWWDFNQMEQLIEAFRANPNLSTFNAYFDDVPIDAVNRSYSGYKESVQKLQGLVQFDAGPEVIEAAVNRMELFLQIKVNIPIVGASGAIYGLLLAFGMYFPNAELMLIFLPIPIKAKYFIPILMIIELYLGLNQFSWDNIAHFAHLGGALTGFLLILYWRKFGSRFDENRWN